MNKEIEKEIARFFQKRVRDRIFFLLSSKKRGVFFGKIAHTVENYIDCALIVQKDERPIEQNTIRKYLGSRVYVIAQCSPLDGEFAAIGEALELWGCGVPYLLYGNGYLYVETEYDFSPHTAYILKGRDIP